MRAFFPLSAKAYDVKSLLIIALIYIAISVVTGFLFGLVNWLPLVGFIFRIVSRLIDFYCLSGIVVAAIICFRLV